MSPEERDEILGHVQDDWYESSVALEMAVMNLGSRPVVADNGDIELTIQEAECAMWEWWSQ